MEHISDGARWHRFPAEAKRGRRRRPRIAPRRRLCAARVRALAKSLFLVALLVGIFVLPSPTISPLFAQEASAGISVQMVARATGEGANTAPTPVAAGDILAADRELQIRIQAKRETHVYVIAYDAASRAATLLHPPSGQAADALLRSDEVRVLPGEDEYLSLAELSSPRRFYAVASRTPPDSLADLLVRVEAAGDDFAAIASLMKERFPDVMEFAIQSERLRVALGAESSRHAMFDPQLDVDAMECLYFWLIGGDSGRASIPPQAGPEAGSGGADSRCVDALPIPLADDVAAGETASPPAASESVAPEITDAIAAGGASPVSPPTPGVSTPTDIIIAEDSEPDPTPAAPPIPLFAPPKGDLLLTLAREAETAAPLRSIDVSADGNVSSAVVLVVTPAATGTGVLLDYAGHVLANWHVVRGYTSVSITFKTPAAAAPSSSRTRSARVVRVSKTSDLALLRIDNPPREIRPVRLAKTNEVRNGDVVHAVGHPDSGDWAYALGKIDQVKPGSSWYAGHNLLHRGTVIFAELSDDPGGAGAPLFNNRLELVGIGAMPRSIRGVLTGVSVETIKEFLRAPPAEAKVSMGG